jgi:triosephosphate isomerase
MRVPLVAGNWKMNLTLRSARELVTALQTSFAVPPPVDVAVCPPYPYLLPVAQAIDGSFIKLGAQNMYFEPNGAYTGEVSAPMLTDLGCTYVIIGHSERRHTIGRGEDDQMLNRKLKAALAAGLTPIFCIGEKLEQRDAAQTNDVLETQLRAGLQGIDEQGLARIVIAYEPVWAIGTGRNATPQQAQEAHGFTRSLLSRMYNASVAAAVRIQYGGSVTPDNAPQLMAQPDVDGALVGGASLKAQPFAAIIEATVRAKRLP